MAPDVIVIRHSMAGAPHLLSRSVKASIINAGDGMHEHPTQALLDLMTIREKKGAIEGSTGGDHRRYRPQPGGPFQYHRTENHGGPGHGGRPPDHDPPHLESFGVEVSYQPEEIIPRADVIMMLRVQLERQQQLLFPSLREYSRFFGLHPGEHEKGQERCNHHASRPDQSGGGTPSRSGRRAVFGHTGPGNQWGGCSNGPALPAFGR